MTGARFPAGGGPGRGIPRAAEAFRNGPEPTTYPLRLRPKVRAVPPLTAAKNAPGPANRFRRGGGGRAAAGVPVEPGAGRGKPRRLAERWEQRPRPKKRLIGSEFWQVGRLGFQGRSGGRIFPFGQPRKPTSTSSGPGDVPGAVPDGDVHDLGLHPAKGPGDLIEKGRPSASGSSGLGRNVPCSPCTPPGTAARSGRDVRFLGVSRGPELVVAHPPGSQWRRAFVSAGWGGKRANPVGANGVPVSGEYLPKRCFQNLGGARKAGLFLFPPSGKKKFLFFCNGVGWDREFLWG